MANFISTTETDIITVGEAAWTQTKAELSTLPTEVLTVLKNAINTAINDLESGATIEEIETAVLNLLSEAAPSIISALSSGALQVIIAAAKTAVAAI